MTGMAPLTGATCADIGKEDGNQKQVSRAQPVYKASIIIGGPDE